MIELKSSKRNYGVILPNSIEEITPEILNEITKRVSLPKHYCVVALCFKTRLFDFVVAMNSKKESSVSVVPIMAKISEEDAKEINCEIGNKLIIDRSALERGSHLRLPVIISTDNIKSYINSDETLVKEIIGSKANTEIGMKKTSPIILLEFKIVPVNDISASVSKGEEPVDPFVIVKGADA